MNDNQCWMTQNLDLDLGIKDASNNIDTTQLYPESSNVTSTWPASGTLAVTQTGTTPYFGTANNSIVSYDPGYSYFDKASNFINTYEALAKDVSRQTTAHYLKGNYYSWTLATARNTNDNDICPKGWQLPLGGNSSGAKLKTFQALTNALGLTSGTDTATGIDTREKLLAAPAYFPYSGMVFNSSVNNTGTSAYYWTSTSKDADNAYSLDFTSSYIMPSHEYAKAVGLSIRCVAR